MLDFDGIVNMLADSYKTNNQNELKMSGKCLGGDLAVHGNRGVATVWGQIDYFVRSFVLGKLGFQG